MSVRLFPDCSDYSGRSSHPCTDIDAMRVEGEFSMLRSMLFDTGKLIFCIGQPCTVLVTIVPPLQTLSM